jgi:acyl carrier protein
MKTNDDLILKAIERFNEGLPEQERLTDVSSDMRFFGRDATGSRILDSMGLVDLLFCVEETVEAELADERLLRQRQSPLRSFRSLSDYVGELLES